MVMAGEKGNGKGEEGGGGDDVNKSYE